MALRASGGEMRSGVWRKKDEGWLGTDGWLLRNVELDDLGEGWGCQSGLPVKTGRGGGTSR